VISAEQQRQIEIEQTPDVASMASANTPQSSHSAQEISDLDIDMIIELLPDLLHRSRELLSVTTPLKMSLQNVETIVQELQAPEGKRRKIMKLREIAFDHTRANYVGMDKYINESYILRRLFGDTEPDFGNLRPDIVLQAANIASIVRELIVLQADDRSTADILQDLDRVFPKHFLSGFSDPAQYGFSILRDEAFNLGLSIRTQSVIAALRKHQEQRNPSSGDAVDPDHILADMFYEEPEERNESLSAYEDALTNGKPKYLAGWVFGSSDSDQTMEDKYQSKIQDRVEEIRRRFLDDTQAHRDGDFVIFEELSAEFPWMGFLFELVDWARQRMVEIESNIKDQGGVKNIKKALLEYIQEANSQVDGQIQIDWEPTEDSSAHSEISEGEEANDEAASKGPQSSKRYYIQTQPSPILGY
jgi:hypothetical protein